MIRINLLPVKAAHRKHVGQRQLALMVIVIVCVAVVLAGYYYSNDAELSTMEQEVSKKEEEIKLLQKKIGAVDKIKSQKSKLISKLQVIQKLEQGKAGPVRVLDALASIIPKRVWITSFTLAGSQLSINGFGVENRDISEFMDALNESKSFSMIQLSSTTKTNKGGQSVYGFSLTFTVNKTA